MGFAVSVLLVTLFIGKVQSKASQYAPLKRKKWVHLYRGLRQPMQLCCSMLVVAYLSAGRGIVAKSTFLFLSNSSVCVKSHPTL